MIEICSGQMEGFWVTVCKTFALCYRTVVCPVCDVCVLWPNVWMHQDATLCGRRPRFWSHCVRWGPSSSKGAQPPIFGTCLLWPNGWIHQDATWYGGSHRPSRHCVRWRPSSPFPKGAQRGTNPQFSANVRCGQTAGWTTMPLGMEVGLGPGD